MSNLKTFNPVDNGNPYPGGQFWSASSGDTVADLLAVGYMNDQKDTIHDGEMVVMRCELDTATEHTRLMQIKFDGTNWNLVNLYLPQLYPLTYAGGASGSFSLPLAGLTANDSVMLSVKTSANAVSLQKYVCATDAIDVVMSGDPGASTFDAWILRPL